MTNENPGQGNKNMLKIIMMIFPSGMTGTIDQISEDKASVEIMAQDGHTHEVVMPIWMIPCLAKEGTEFFIEIDKDITVIKCKSK
tara:strand:+ start:6133 stop:6387 length:255 start_codon:yes stop_codon:yes gene_type:complete